MDQRSYDISNAFGRRRNLWAGYHPKDWIARLVGDPIIPLKLNKTKKPWRISWIDKRIYLSSFHLSKDNAIAYANILDRMQPRFIMGYPSSLEILSSFLYNTGKNT